MNTFIRNKVVQATLAISLMAPSLPVGAVDHPAGRNQILVSSAMTAASQNQPTFEIDKPERSVLQYIDTDQITAAYKEIEAARLQVKGSPADIRLLYLRAYLENEDENYKAAIKSLQEIQRLENLKSSRDVRKQILTLKRIGDVYYHLRDMQASAAAYKSGLSLSEGLEPLDGLRTALLESIIGCLIHKGNFVDAEPYGKQLVQLTQQQATSGQLSDQAGWFWAQLELLQLYRRLGKQQEHHDLRTSVEPMLDKVLSVRAQLDAAGNLPKFEDIRNEFLSKYISENHPQSLGEYLWLISEYKMRSLPLLSWQQVAQRPRAAMLCVHGLGLDNRAFQYFARDMVTRGFVVYAMDVRGFGSWLTSPGSEDASFRQAVSDVPTVVNLINQRHPGVPVFLLGESMGGALALRAGSQYGALVQGIVASVPSAEIFQQRRMSFTVARHLLRNPNMPFSIGQMITERATSQDALRKSWQSDPKAKMEMSPKELIRFAIFMRTTERHCKEIKTTPVLIVQGLKDKLVKPQGTYDMFDNVASEDKTLIIVGTAEHLIFETPHQSPVVLDSVTSWLNAHCPVRPN